MRYPVHGIIQLRIEKGSTKMNALKGLYAIVLVMAVCLAGCSQGGTPIAPGPDEILNSASADGGTSHALWGLYTFVCRPESQSVDIITLRDAGMPA